MPKHPSHNIIHKNTGCKRGPTLWLTGLPTPRVSASEHVSTTAPSSSTGLNVMVGNTDGMATQLYTVLSTRAQVHSVRILPSTSKKHDRGMVRDAEIEVASILDAQMILLSKPWYVLSTEDPLGIELCPSDRTMRFELSRKLDKVDRLILTDRSIISLQWVRPDKEPWAQSLVRTFVARFTTHFTIPAASEQPKLGAKAKNVAARVSLMCDTLDDALVVYSNLRDLDLSTGIKLIWPEPRNSFVVSALKDLRLPTPTLRTILPSAIPPVVPPVVVSAPSISHEKAQVAPNSLDKGPSQESENTTIPSSIDVYPYDTLNVISEAGWCKTLRPSDINRLRFPLQSRKEEPREGAYLLPSPQVDGVRETPLILQQIEQGQVSQESRSLSDSVASNSHIQFWQFHQSQETWPSAHFGSVGPQSVPTHPVPYSQPQSAVRSSAAQARVARTVWVGLFGAKPGFGTEDLRSFFEPCGTIEEVFLPTVAIPKYALVVFDDALGAQQALDWNGSYFRGTRLQIKPKTITAHAHRSRSTTKAASASRRSLVPTSPRNGPPTTPPTALQAAVPSDPLRASAPAILPRPEKQHSTFDTHDSPLSFRHVRSISILARQLNTVPISTIEHKNGKSSDTLMPTIDSSVTNLLPGALYMSSSASEAYRIKFPPSASTPLAQSPKLDGVMGTTLEQETPTQRKGLGNGTVLWPAESSVQSRTNPAPPAQDVFTEWSTVETPMARKGLSAAARTIVPGSPPLFNNSTESASVATPSGSSTEYLIIPSTSDPSFSPGRMTHHDRSTKVAPVSPSENAGQDTISTQEHSPSSRAKAGSHGNKEESKESSNSSEQWSLTGYPPSSLVSQVNHLSSSNSGQGVSEATRSLTSDSNSGPSSGGKHGVAGTDPNLSPISEALRVLPSNDEPRQQPVSPLQEPPFISPTVQCAPNFSSVQHLPNFNPPIQQSLSNLNPPLIQQPYVFPSQTQEGIVYSAPLPPPPMLYLPPGMGMMPTYPSPSGYPPPGMPTTPVYGPHGVSPLIHGSPYGPPSPLPMTPSGPYLYTLTSQYGPPLPIRMMPPQMGPPGPQLPFLPSPFAYPSPYLHPSGSPPDDGPTG